MSRTSRSCLLSSWTLDGFNKLSINLQAVSACHYARLINSGRGKSMISLAQTEKIKCEKEIKRFNPFSASQCSFLYKTSLFSSTRLDIMDTHTNTLLQLPPPSDRWL